MDDGTRAKLASDTANRMTGVVNVDSNSDTLSYLNSALDHIGNRTSIQDNGADASNRVCDGYGQQTVHFYRPAATALKWFGLSAGPSNLLSLDRSNDLFVWSLPAGGTGTSAFSPTGNRRTQTDSVSRDITTFTCDNNGKVPARHHAECHESDESILFFTSCVRMISVNGQDADRNPGINRDEAPGAPNPLRIDEQIPITDWS
jgi:hypothetical protein